QAWRDRRVFLAGDAAHLMSPFGARGLNSGAADAANLAWKLEHVLAGKASETLLDSYSDERCAAAKENLAVTEETMHFMAPAPEFRAERDRILRASTTDTKARTAVNSGRLATPMIYSGGLFPAHRSGDQKLVGTVLVDVVTADGSRLRRRLADVAGGWLALTTGHRSPEVPAGVVAMADDSLTVRAAYAPDGRARTWLIRPDGYVAACTEPNAADVHAAWLTGTGATERSGPATPVV
ncbi:MAG: FAD-dependent monooxygenase, partial [Geodermatophilaceae bacterium]|nr:FAD-dependent monooxygenase [Geodermatophilaceae bacterium]